MSKFKILFFIFFALSFFLFTKPIYAISDPLAVPNNKFGIHIIQPTPDESSPAASLVNSSGGDWGYITVLIEGKDKKVDKWQQFFNDLRRRHLIPLVRIASIPDSKGFWKKPDPGEANNWADFLNSLNWPTKNRYVIIYNEPNQGQEWGNLVDPADYAKTLDQTIKALKNKNSDFFVLNAGLDASAPNQTPNYQDETSFLEQMNSAVPGIFNELDGWVSHSYPNPGFAGSPQGVGKGTVRTFRWEMDQLRSLGLNKNLPIFITETGWKHAEGLKYDFSLPTADTVSDYFQNAFENAWSDPDIVAVTPFLLSYQDSPFDHFSFKKVAKSSQIEAPNSTIDNSSPFYSPFETIQSLPKTAGKPIQQMSGKLLKGEIYSSIVSNQTYTITLTFENNGQSIWNDSDTVSLVPTSGGNELGLQKVSIGKDIKIEPNSKYTFTLNLKAPESGKFNVKLQLFSNDKEFESKDIEFTTEVKSPVILQVLTKLKWKDSPAGEYVLSFGGVYGQNTKSVELDSSGKSQVVEADDLLPDYNFDFTLKKPFYYPKTIHQGVKSGVNTLDFGTLEPDFLQAVLHPLEFWKLSPWSH